MAFLSGLDFFVHDSRVSFSIRERKPEIVVSVSVFQVLWSKKRRIDSDNFLQDRFVPSTISSYGRRRPTGSSEGHRRGRVRPSDPFAPARSGLSLSAAIFHSGALLVDSRVRVGHLERLNGVYRHPNSIRISDTPRFVARLAVAKFSPAHPPNTSRMDRSDNSTRSQDMRFGPSAHPHNLRSYGPWGG